MLPFTLNFQDGIPVSDQILRAVRKAVLTGQLVAGDPFPSVRAMIQELKISPTTAHKVVSHLKAAGYLAHLRENDPETVKQAERFFFVN